MPLVTVKVPEGLFDERAKAGLIERITDAVIDVAASTVEVEGGLPDKTWVFIEEVKPGNWGVAGRAVRPRRRTARMGAGAQEERDERD
ncbi:MAG: 4-oxalocrotonate tautomerase family protein [Actinomycetota bacterium]